MGISSVVFEEVDIEMERFNFQVHNNNSKLVRVLLLLMKAYIRWNFFFFLQKT